MTSILRDSLALGRKKLIGQKLQHDPLLAELLEKAVHTAEKCLRNLAWLTGQNVQKSVAVTSFLRKHAELQASDVVNEHLKWNEKRHPRRLPGIDMRPLRLYFGHLTDIYATLLMTWNCHRVTVILFLSIVLSVAVVCA